MSTMTDVKAWNGTEILHAFIEFRHKDSGGSAATYYWAGVALTDASTYHGGYKEARVVEFGPIRQGLSDSSGRIKINSCEFTLSDFPDDSGEMLLRGFLGDTDTLGIIDAEVVIRLVTDTDRRAATAATVVFRGVVTAYEALEPYLFRFECEDIFGAHPLRSITLPITNTTAFTGIGTTFGTSPDYLGQKIGIPYGVLADSGQGAILCRPIGQVTALDASTWYGFAVAACAIASVDDGWYVDGGSLNAITWDDVTWSKQGSAGYTALFGDDYFDAPDGRRYTIVYTSDSGLAGVPVTVNVHGVEDVGDASGTCLTSIYDIIAHIFDNFVGTDTPWTGGDWGSIPTWADGTARRNATDFSDTETAAATAIPDGPDAAFWLIEDVDGAELLAQLALCGDCDHGTNLAGQYAVHIDSPGSPTSTFTETSHILAESFRFSGRKTDLINTASVNYKPRYLGVGAAALDASLVFRTDPPSMRLTATASDSDSDSVTNHGEVAADPVDLIAIHDASQAGEILARRIARTAEPRQGYQEVGIHHLLSDGLEAGHTIEVTHRQGATATGWTDKALYVRDVLVDIQRLKLGLDFADLEAAAP